MVNALQWGMPNPLIPTPEHAPPSIRHLPVEKRIQLWFELLDESQALLLAGLRVKIGPEGDLHTAYREWNERHMADHERMLIAMAENLSRRESRHDG